MVTSNSSLWRHTGQFRIIGWNLGQDSLHGYDEIEPQSTRNKHNEPCEKSRFPVLDSTKIVDNSALATNAWIRDIMRRTSCLAAGSVGVKFRSVTR